MKITVYFDGACPLCVREVSRWRNASFSCEVEWFDITGQEQALNERGIDPRQAMLQLHTQTSDGNTFVSIDSYALLLEQLPRWRWLGKLMALPVIKPVLRWSYDGLTILRLKSEGRYPGSCSDCSVSKRDQ
ncbi:thiol-disulfide oxidoreductase DCC family protein [Endozoicomonas montiporae]|uniref:Thiol-disulfide oxidoreductase DCC n=1 Tax=Endozoicomonas montiporae CL-33 TaxID=570277 RepID=A0A142BH28_9GAMM|nr:DUF393 domain-containing protein [Endozoicomonas montiporae]AMO58054.1 hypothetical protein EZMO1_4126 [Endozoicomonas montiporae CL-33]